MNENLTILKKGFVLILIPFLFQILFLGILSKINADNARAQTWAIHTKVVIAKAEATIRKLIEAHGEIRALVISANPAFQKRAESLLKEVPADFAELEKLVEDNQSQQALAREIASTAGELGVWQEQVGSMVAGGRQSDAVEMVRSLEGKRLVDKIRLDLDAMLAEEGRLDAIRIADLERSTRLQNWMLGLGALLSLATVGILAFVFGRGVSRRFASLTENVQRLAEGKELVRPLPGSDEIAQLDRVFHGMARAIADKNRENEMFIYSVSHDLRSPLVNLQGFSQELGFAAKELRKIVTTAEVPAQVRTGAVALIDQDVDASIHFIQTAVTRLSLIIDALLRLSRAGRVEYRWQMVDVETIVNRVVESLGSTVTERGAMVSIIRPIPQAWGDPTGVEQIFANLLGNAVNYLDPARPGVIEVGVLRGAAGPLHTYYVKDNGRGIPESGLSKLFLAFQRFHESAARGEGIGLALVRRVVERHGGKIRVESKAGSGSTFFVELPCRAPDSSPMGGVNEVYAGKGEFA